MSSHPSSRGTGRCRAAGVTSHHSSVRGSPERKHREKEELDCVLETDRSAWCGVNPRGRWWEGVKLGMRKKQKLDRAVPGRPPVGLHHALSAQHSSALFWGYYNKRQGAGDSSRLGLWH